MPAGNLRRPRYDCEAFDSRIGAEQPHELLERPYRKPNCHGGRIVFGKRLAQKAHHLLRIRFCE